jgi:hypothetical protein
MNLDLARDLVAQLQAALKPDTVLKPGDNLQLALNNALPGDTIELEVGEYPGPIYLPAKSAPVRLTTRGLQPGGRVSPDMPLARILSTASEPTIDGNGAANWVLDGLHVGPRQDGLGDVIVLQDAENITLSRIVIVGGANGQKRGIRGNGKHIMLTQSHIANCWRTGQDSQAFCAWDGAGPYEIYDNYLEAASENVMFGGADSLSVDRIPSDITIEGNTFVKNLAWQGVSGYAVKNLLEFKVGKRVSIRDNTFSGCWTDAQTGYAILFKSVNQDGRAPWSALEDVEFCNNTVDAENGIGIQGIAFDQPGGQTTRINIHHNTITSWVGVKLGSHAGIVAVTDNTFDNKGTLLQLYGTPACDQLDWSRNRYKDVPYGIKGDGTASGEPSLKAFCGAYTYAGNVIG